jgi:DNA helicase HerA-like ATPase
MSFEERIKNGNPIGVVGSPNSTTEFSVDVLEGSIDSPLQGKILNFAHQEGGDEKLVLGQVTDLTSENKWHEEDVLKSVIKKKGALDYLSGDADVKSATLKLLGAFEQDEDNFEKTTLNTPPASGTELYEASNEIIRSIVAELEGIFYLGQIYGSETVAPFQLKHFGPPPGGFGEAHRIGIFGKSGTGKSVMGASMIGGFAKNEEMGILLLDPQGQFGQDEFGGREFEFSFDELIEETRGDYINRGIDDIAMESKATFSALLAEIDLFSDLGIKGPSQHKQAVENFEAWLKRESIDPSEIDIDQFIDRVANIADRVYVGDDKDQEIHDEYDERQGLYNWRFDTVQELFEEGDGKISVGRLIDQVLDNRELVVLNLDFDPEEALNAPMMDPSNVRDNALLGILNTLQSRYQSKYRGGGQSNAMVVLDEAHQYLQKSDPDKEVKKQIKRKVSKAQLTSRKYGIGWLFINQRTANFDEQVYSQLEDHVFCSGLDVGRDKDLVIDTVDREMFDEYSKLPNPNQSDIYTFMISGSIVALGTTGQPLFIEGFDSLPELLENN